MRKLLVIASLLAMTSVASAEDWRHERHHPAPRVVHRGHGGWVGPAFLLGLGAAAAVGTIFYYEGHRCWNELAGYDEWGNRLVRRVCE
jgi:hypothetical protein